MIERIIKEYSLEDMLEIEDMSWGDALRYLDDLDRGHFNQFVYLSKDENRTYSEDEHYTYALRIALNKAMSALKGLAMQAEMYGEE